MDIKYGILQIGLIYSFFQVCLIQCKYYFIDLMCYLYISLNLGNCIYDFKLS